MERFKDHSKNYVISDNPNIFHRINNEEVVESSIADIDPTVSNIHSSQVNITQIENRGENQTISNL